MTEGMKEARETHNRGLCVGKTLTSGRDKVQPGRTRSNPPRLLNPFKIKVIFYFWAKMADQLWRELICCVFSLALSC